MLSRHKQTLVRLFSKCQKTYANPQESGKECLEVQEILIQKITYIERRIRDRKEAIKILKKKMGQSEIQLSKEDARKAKTQIGNYHYQIGQYQYLATVYRNVGDALAFSYIDKWNIKPLAINEAPGSLSLKSGSRLERKILRRAFASGHIVLLNDITNCLRFGDITVPRDGKFMLIEAKSSKRRTDRDYRQTIEAKNLLKFYETDYSEKLFGRDDGTKRIGFGAPEIHHRDNIDDLVLSAINNGNSYIKAEEGLYYIASTNFDPQVVISIFDKCEGTPLVGLMGQNSDVHFYIPMILILQDPESIYKFYEGQLSFIIIVDSGVAKRKLQAHKVYIEFTAGDKEWVAKVSKDDNFVSKIGAALWGRIYAEFISLDWFLNDIVLHITELSPTILSGNN